MWQYRIRKKREIKNEMMLKWIETSITMKLKQKNIVKIGKSVFEFLFEEKKMEKLVFIHLHNNCDDIKNIKISITAEIYYYPKSSQIFQIIYIITHTFTAAYLFHHDHSIKFDYFIYFTGHMALTFVWFSITIKNNN